MGKKAGPRRSWHARASRRIPRRPTRRSTGRSGSASTPAAATSPNAALWHEGSERSSRKPPTPAPAPPAPAQRAPQPSPARHGVAKRSQIVFGFVAPVFDQAVIEVSDGEEVEASSEDDLLGADPGLCETSHSPARQAQKRNVNSWSESSLSSSSSSSS